MKTAKSQGIIRKMRGTLRGRTSLESPTTKFDIIHAVRPSNTMRSTAPFAFSAAPAEAGHDIGAGTAYSVRTYTEVSGVFVQMRQKSSGRLVFLEKFR